MAFVRPETPEQPPGYEWWASPANEEKIFNGIRQGDGTFYQRDQARVYSREAMGAARWWYNAAHVWWVLLFIPLAAVGVFCLLSLGVHLIHSGLWLVLVVMMAPGYGLAVWQSRKSSTLATRPGRRRDETLER